MKKIICLLMALLIFTGCTTNIDNTPTKKVEEFLSKYQSLDQEVIKDLDKVIEEEEKFNTINREEYKELIEKQYKDLTYIIKNETLNGDEAIVEAEITVKDYKKVMDEAEVYKNTYISEFYNDSGIYDETKYINYVIEQLKNTKDSVKYTIYINTKKIDDKWQVQQIDSVTEDKILGIYSY